MSKEYTLAEVRYAKDQLIFLLNNLGSLQAGVWPGDEPNIPGHEDCESKGGVYGSSPPYIPDKEVIRIAREIDRRLLACGDDGSLLRERYSEHKTVEQLARMFSVSRWLVYHRCQRALKYLEGWRYKRISYPEWCKRKEK